MSPHANLMEESVKDPLPRLYEKFAGEYGDTLPKDEIEGAAEDALEEFGSARLREFVPIFAWRHARERLY